MNPPKNFLSAEWRKLMMANYVVAENILQPYVPKHTQLDIFEGKCLVSLVGFMFMHTKLKGVSIPFHQTFEEVNLRFYVKYLENGVWKRGVVFIQEIVPKRMLAVVARLVYGEPYVTMPMTHKWQETVDNLYVDYRWKKGANWHLMQINCATNPVEIAPNSEAEFITEHYWGYTKHSPNNTSEYEVEHPRWQIYPTKAYQIKVDFVAVYGKDFAFLNELTPHSVFLTEGSGIWVKEGKKL